LSRHFAGALALRANAKELKGVSHVGVSHLPGDPLEGVDDTDIDDLHFAANSADHVMVVVSGVIELVPVSAISEVASSQKT
jgi:hypothetical protein